MNINSKLTLVGLAIIASVIASPFVYAAVEPHIILTMDSAQTTSPFLIQNNTSYPIFEIEPDGRQSGWVNTAVSTDVSEISVTAANDITDPVIIASWVFDRTLTDVEDGTNIPLNALYHSVHVKRDTGSGTCKAGWIYLDSGVWAEITTSSGTSGSWTNRQGSTGETWMPDTTEIWAYALYNSDSATTCTFKNIASIGSFVLGTDLAYYRGV